MADSKTEIHRWLPNASDDYIKARRSLLEAELALSEQIERVAEMRRALPAGPNLEKDYTFTDASIGASLDKPRTVKLSELVKDRSLVVYHLMFSEDADQPCAMCNMWVDGFNGVATHLEQNVDFVVVGKAPPAKLQEWAKKRGWNGVKVFSSFGSDFNKDFNFEHPNWMPEGDQVPGVSVLKKEGNVIQHVYSMGADFYPGRLRGVDQLNPVWNVLDLTPEGRGEWWASLKYLPTQV